LHRPALRRLRLLDRNHRRSLTIPRPRGTGRRCPWHHRERRHNRRPHHLYRPRGHQEKRQECAPILSSNDIPTTVAGAFSQELSERGFKIGPGGVTLKVQVVQFYNDFKTGFFAAHAVSNVAFNTAIVAPDGAIAFSKYYQGTGDNPNLQLMGGSEARPALIKAFQSAVASAVNDPDFIHALIAAGAKAPQT
jgi:uncharacterized lipoprotein